MATTNQATGTIAATNLATEQAQLQRQDERQTVELCGDERGSRRCILARGHEGDHECHTAIAIHCWK